MFDKIDIEELKEKYSKELIEKLDIENVAKIFDYLHKNGIYFAKDIFMNDLPLFLLDEKEFFIKFEKLKNKLGSNYIIKLEENSELLEEMY